MAVKNTFEVATEHTVAAGSEVISESHFGGVFVGYRGIDRFDGLIDEVNSGLIRWPGGDAAERRDWYGLEFEDLVDPNSAKAGLTEVFALAKSNGQDVAIVIPTSDYVLSPEQAAIDLYDFLVRLQSGVIGEAPPKVILELGNEYYAMPEFVENPALYGEIASSMLEGVQAFLEDYPNAEDAFDLAAMAQLGKSLEDNLEIINAISPSVIDEISGLTFHRYPWTMDGAEAIEGTVELGYQAWVEAGLDPGADLFVSEWNIASWTRGEALSRYAALYQENFGASVDADAIDLDARNHVDFEHFWQTGNLRGPGGTIIDTQWGLEKRDYGLSQASGMLDLFSSLVRSGVDYVSIYGIDTQHSARISFDDSRFVGAAMFEMMSESLVGTRLLDLPYDNRRDDTANIFAFQGTNKTVIYISAESLGLAGASSATIDLSSFGEGALNITGRRLTSELDPNWMAVHGIVDVAGIDETPESRMYQAGVIDDYVPVINDGILQIEFTESFEVIEIVIQHDEPISTIDQPKPVESVDLVGTIDNDLLVGGDGNDSIQGGIGNDTILGGDGRDTVLSGNGRDEVWLGAGNDLFRDGAQETSWGADLVYAGAGDDQLFAFGGDDFIDLGSGNDVVQAGNGDDTILAYDGGDTIYAEDGDDHVTSDATIGHFHGGLGSDAIDFRSADGALMLNSEKLISADGVGQLDGFEEVHGTGFDDQITNVHIIDTLDLGAGDDVSHSNGQAGSVIYGGTGDDLITLAPGTTGYGGAGNDVLKSAAADEFLFGDAGNDHFIVETGNDVVTTGSGSDTIWIQTIDRGTATVVTDFNVEADAISLAGAYSFQSLVADGSLKMEQADDDLVFSLYDGWSVTLQDVSADDFMNL